jgi:hypothetical protein
MNYLDYNIPDLPPLANAASVLNAVEQLRAHPCLTDEFRRHSRQTLGRKQRVDAVKDMYNRLVGLFKDTERLNILDPRTLYHSGNWVGLRAVVVQSQQGLSLVRPEKRQQKGKFGGNNYTDVFQDALRNIQSAAEKTQKAEAATGTPHLNCG